MKTTLALLIAGLIFLATPMLASADNSHNHKQYQSKQSHQQRQVSQYAHNNRYHQNRNLRASQHLKKELRETRQQLRQVKRQKQQQHQRPHYAKSVVLIGVPNLLFHFDW
ncbi:hypothetical protein SAMN05660420_01960 [Desulfuromusa kysingii]|uniref:Uncharacterized protein n=1 Tax=Desulfuromusa kysingii TaxID=37625 RepID=A0A1H4ASJ4_9BACT|nr:hypothetical protein [Desulfuromusa kysingii]SEA38744.1 hypothetical protein SAMN05660420_01960 [Desulfuromusa kysingii]